MRVHFVALVRQTTLERMLQVASLELGALTLAPPEHPLCPGLFTLDVGPRATVVPIQNADRVPSALRHYLGSVAP